ncbi:hypothetical protein C8F04DRAFT_1084392 [Mycena alexandri]|uniref:Uncharacterized protein n=1 Tax=Mycena alexandri TaxID=1745969 RepID=A0AAD6T6F6_9AGAR|nr:hypothetical protein C8F04DRAFT_1084392 [Mycena alexandri]
MRLPFFSLSIPIIDSCGRIIAVLGGTPHDVEGWRVITDHAAIFMYGGGQVLIRRSNVPIAANKFQCSFIQYTAGGLFRFIRNGFKTDDAFELAAMKKEERERAQEAKSRWEEGVAMYSTLDSLES